MRSGLKATFLVVITIFTVNVAQAGEVSKEVWINAMSTALPTAICQSSQYFRQCFDVSQLKCEETALSATRICLRKYGAEIPNVLNQPRDGKHWGRIVGSCVGEAYEMTLMHKRIDNAKCNDISNWQ